MNEFSYEPFGVPIDYHHSAQPLDTKTTAIERDDLYRIRRPGCIYFSDDVVEHDIPTLDQLPIEAIWYCREEYDRIKSFNSAIVRMVKGGGFAESKEYSARGLEHKLKEVFRQRRANKFNALNAVLEEQDRQLNRGMYDADMISLAYRAITERCHAAAAVVALRDYENSLNYDPNKPADGKRNEEKAQKPKKKGVRNILAGTRKKMMRRLSL